METSKVNGAVKVATKEDMTPVQTEWKLSAWAGKPNPQEVSYAQDEKITIAALQRLHQLPPLVTPTEIENLKGLLRDCAEGKAFLLQGGDCAELFEYCTTDSIEGKMKLLFQMSLVLIWGLHKPVVRIARMAGQYAKPRSSPTEVVDGKTVTSFKGDILNGFSLDERELDPSRLLR